MPLGQLVVSIVGNTTQFDGSINAAQAKFKSMTQMVAQSSQNITSAFKQIEGEAAVWGRSVDLITQKQTVLKQEINRLIAEGVDPLDQRIEVLQKQYYDLGNEAEALGKSQFGLQQEMQKIGDSFRRVGDSIIVYDSRVEANRIKQEELKNQMNTLLQQGISPLDGSIVKLKNDYLELEEQTAQLEKSQLSLTDSLEEVGQAAGKFGMVMSVAVTLPLMLAAKAAVDAAASMETQAISFEVLLGSATKGKKLLEEMKKFADVTPFTFGDMTQGAKTMLQYGVAAEKIMPITKMLGDIALGNSTKLGQLTYVFGQITGAGKLMGQDLMQLISAGFNPLKEISRTTGESMGSLREKMSKGAISSDMVMESFKTATQQGGAFYLGTEKLGKSFEGLQSTLGDTVTTLARGFGEVMMPALKNATIGLTDFVTKLNGMSDTARVAIIGIGATAAAIGPLLLAFKGLTVAINLFNAASLFLIANPIIAGIMATVVAIGLLVTAYATMKKSVDDQKKAEKEYQEQMAEYNKLQEEEARRRGQLTYNQIQLDIYNDRAEILRKIRELENPKYLDASIRGYAEYNAQLKENNAAQVENLKALLPALDARQKELNLLRNPSKVDDSGTTKLTEVQIALNNAYDEMKKKYDIAVTSANNLKNAGLIPLEEAQNQVNTATKEFVEAMVAAGMSTTDPRLATYLIYLKNLKETLTNVNDLEAASAEKRLTIAAGREKAFTADTEAVAAYNDVVVEQTAAEIESARKVALAAEARGKALETVGKKYVEAQEEIDRKSKEMAANGAGIDEALTEKKAQQSYKRRNITGEEMAAAAKYITIQDEAAQKSIENNKKIIAAEEARGRAMEAMDTSVEQTRANTLAWQQQQLDEARTAELNKNEVARRKELAGLNELGDKGKTILLEKIKGGEEYGNQQIAIANKIISANTGILESAVKNRIEEEKAGIERAKAANTAGDAIISNALQIISSNTDALESLADLKEAVGVSIADEYEKAKSNIEEQKQAYLKLGADKVEAEKWASEQIININQQK
jgi:tape measure domain-containing protein